MTLKEKAMELYPEKIVVDDCPINFPGLGKYCLHPDGCSEDDDCNACWSQEYREPQKPQPKKLNASAVFIVLAVLEAAASAVAVMLGDSDMVRFCCVMGLLYIIAAGVWRNKP